MIRLLPFLLVGCIVGELLAQQAPQSGEALFFGKAACASCHEVNGRGGIVGPDLSNAGRLSADALRQKIVDPSANPNPGGRGGPSTMVARTKDGKEIRGIRRAEDTFSLLITDASGKLLRLDKRDLASATVEQKSLMPADFAQRLSEPEIQSLVAYLRTQTARDLTKTIQAEIPGGVTYDRLLQRRRRAAELAHLLGRLSRAALLCAETGGHFERPAASGAMDDPTGGGDRLEATPIVVDGIMYTSGAPGQVLALDAETGLPIWQYRRQQKVVNPSGQSLHPGRVGAGEPCVPGTLDAALVALDARTGRLLWETQVADTMLGYTITSPPLALRDKIITGVSGGECRRERIHRRLRSRDRQTAVALQHDSRSRRIRPRYMERRKLAARRRPDVAHRQLRSGFRYAVLDHSAIPAPTMTGTYARATTCLHVRSSLSIRIPAAANGIISSRRTTPTIGIPPKT